MYREYTNIGGVKMREDITVGEITDIFEKASTNFERTNTEIKRKYLI